MAQIDLSRLPPPDVIERLDFAAIKASMIADLVGRDDEYDALVESDPALKIIEACAYRELLVRARCNDAARAVMLAYALDADLDHLAALFGVRREDGESDVRLRERTQLSLEGYTTAGSEASYRFHALGADPSVVDVSIASTVAGTVSVVVLGGDQADGAADAALIGIVDAALSASDVRPLTDTAEVAAVEILPYEVDAELAVDAGPDPDVVVAAARAAVESVCLAAHRVGATVHRSALIAAAHAAGVVGVALTSPAANVAATAAQAPWCTAGTSNPYTSPAHHPFDGVSVAAG